MKYFILFMLLVFSQNSCVSRMKYDKVIKIPGYIDTEKSLEVIYITNNERTVIGGRFQSMNNELSSDRKAFILFEGKDNSWQTYNLGRGEIREITELNDNIYAVKITRKKNSLMDSSFIFQYVDDLNSWIEVDRFPFMVDKLCINEEGTKFFLKYDYTNVRQLYSNVKGNSEWNSIYVDTNNKYFNLFSVNKKIRLVNYANNSFVYMDVINNDKPLKRVEFVIEKSIVINKINFIGNDILIVGHYENKDENNIQVYSFNTIDNKLSQISYIDTDYLPGLLNYYNGILSMTVSKPVGFFNDNQIWYSKDNGVSWETHKSISLGYFYQSPFFKAGKYYGYIGEGRIGVIEVR